MEPRLRFRSAGVVAFGALAVLTCAMFALAASTVIAVAVASGRIEQPADLIPRMVAKAAGFAVIAAIAIRFLRARRGVAADQAIHPPTVHLQPVHYLLVLVLLLGAGAFLLPRLNTYPYPEPDELHHLIVARNVAVYGEYASGHPAQGLVRFDPYDSVGPPVILPIAASLRIFEISLAAGRAPMIVCFLVLIVLMVRLFTPVLGPSAALLGGVFLLVAWGSIYLARSVYGEVPALMFFVAALLCWRHSRSNSPWIWACIAGVLLGVATLSKSILLMTAFPFAAVVLFDRWNHRRLRIPHMVMPVAGVAAMHTLWLLAEALAGDAAPFGGTIGLYQHNLMFGFGGVSAALHWIAANQVVFLPAAIAGLVLVASPLMARPDPAVLVALLSAVLYLFWWCFFTDGHIPRYLWFTLAILSFPFAHLLLRLAQIATTRPGRLRTILSAAVVVALCAPYAPLLGYELDRVYGNVQVGLDEQRVLDHLAGLPETARLATTWWPLERWGNFFLNRPMPVVDDAFDALESEDVVVSKGYADADLLNPHILARKMGAYVIYRKEP